MLFNSYEFIFVFFPITVLIYFYLNRKGLNVLSKLFLVLSSLLFYSWWNIVYLPIILLSIIFNFFIGKLLWNKKELKKITRKQLLIFGIVCNVGLLCYFKYVDFFIINLNFIGGLDIQLLTLTLPLAISFFTFQQIAYLVDSFKRETQDYDFLNYTVFVTFFPQLIAGPIVHHKQMMPQFTNFKNKDMNYRNIGLGLYIFSIGLFKKVVIADTFSIWSTAGFDASTNLNMLEAWVTSLSYTFQLYFDFSGYTDMAVGAALFFNIVLPINFNSPYKAINIQDFWRRWHITLSRFLRDYIYIPLGGNQKGESRVYYNIMITFLLGGLWHGAGWTFIFWGFLHGISLLAHRIWGKIGFKISKSLSWFITFNFVNITWVFFRAKEWEDAMKVLTGMFGFNGIKLPNFLEKVSYISKSFNVEFADLSNIKGNDLTYVWLILGFIIVLLFNNSYQKMTSFKMGYKTICFSTFLFILSILSLTKVSEFLYFNF